MSFELFDWLEISKRPNVDESIVAAARQINVIAAYCNGVNFASM